MRQNYIATLLHGKDTMNNIIYAHFIYERAKATAAKIYQQRGWVDASVNSQNNYDEISLSVMLA